MIYYFTRIWFSTKRAWDGVQFGSSKRQNKRILVVIFSIKLHATIGTYYSVASGFIYSLSLSWKVVSLFLCKSYIEIYVIAYMVLLSVKVHMPQNNLVYLQAFLQFHDTLTTYFTYGFYLMFLNDLLVLYIMINDLLYSMFSYAHCSHS